MLRFSEFQQLLGGALIAQGVEGPEDLQRGVSAMGLPPRERARGLICSPPFTLRLVEFNAKVLKNLIGSWTRIPSSLQRCHQ